MSDAAETTVDARGHRCPVPTLRLQRALATVSGGACVTLLADDPLARIDVPHFASQHDHELVETGEAAGGALRFVVRKSTSAVAAARGSPGD